MTEIVADVVVTETVAAVVVTETVAAIVAVTDIVDDVVVKETVADVAVTEIVADILAATETVADVSMGKIGIWHYSSTMNIGTNVEDTKFGVVSLVISHYFFQDGGFMSYP